MAKSTKINQIQDQHKLLKSTTIPELQEIRNTYGDFEGANLIETKSNIKFISDTIESLLNGNFANELSWNSLNSIASGLQNIQSAFSQFKHTSDQQSFVNFSHQIDSVLQQIQMYGFPAFWTDECQLKENKKKIAELRLEIDEITNSTSSLENQILKFETTINDPVNKLNKIYDETKISLNSKEQEINTLLESSAGKLIAGSYSDSAKTEKWQADIFRIASLICMFSIIALIGSAIWQSTSTEFQWESSIFRIGLAFMLSVPAAYLARESAKHREQQYTHHQTALDLKAINPYLASLDPSLQQEIKAEIAKKIFSPRDYAKHGTDSYPINNQEIIMQLLKIVESKKSA